MKSFLNAVSLIVAVTAISWTTNVNATIITDDFSDGTDGAAGTATNPVASPPNVSGPVWSRLDKLANSTGQVWDASTFQYHLTAPNNGVQSLGFIGSYVPTSFTDVNVMSDVVSFVGPPTGHVFGVAARLNGNNAALGGLTGYAYAYEPFAASGTGEMVLYRINPALSISDIGSQQVTLDPNKDYTFSLSIIGTQLHGKVTEVGGGVVAEKYATDATYASGFSGLISYSQVPLPSVNVTWDNFKTGDVPEPASCVLVAFGACAMLLGRRHR